MLQITILKILISLPKGPGNTFPTTISPYSRSTKWKNKRKVMQDHPALTCLKPLNHAWGTSIIISIQSFNLHFTFWKYYNKLLCGHILIWS